MLNEMLPFKCFQPRFLSHMRKKAPLTVERKNRQGRVASEQTPHPSSCPPQAADRCRPFRCSSFSHTNRFAGFAWEPCSLCNPIKTTKEGDCGPFLGFSPEFGLCRDRFRFAKRGIDASLLNRRGSRNTLRQGRADRGVRPYKPLDSGNASNFIRTIFNGRKRSDSHSIACAWKPDWTAARRAFGRRTV